MKYLKFKLTKKLSFSDETMNRLGAKILRPFIMLAAKNQRRSILGQLSTMIPSYIDLNW